MPKRIPISTAKEVAEKHDLRQVIVAAWDGERTHIVTYGTSVEDCAQAADGGNLIKKALGWPKHLKAEPNRVSKLKAKIAALNKQVKELNQLFAAK